MTMVARGSPTLPLLVIVVHEHGGVCEHDIYGTCNVILCPTTQKVAFNTVDDHNGNGKGCFCCWYHYSVSVYCLVKPTKLGSPQGAFGVSSLFTNESLVSSRRLSGILKATFPNQRISKCALARQTMLKYVYAHQT
jgi:hypothetical protein